MIIDENHKKRNYIVDYIMRIISYAFVLILTSLIFKKTLYIDNSYFGLWAVVATIIIFLLNKTIKPVLVLTTLPITIMTLGLFYPIVNVLILKITDFILGDHFQVNGIIMPVVLSLVISYLNIVLENILRKKYGC